MHYIAMIEEPEKGNEAYGVIFPDLNGCYAASDKGFDDAVINATEALSLWFEAASDDEKAKPSSLQEILKADHAGDYKNMIPVAIPLIHEVGRVSRVNISLDEGLHNLFTDHAKRHGVTLSRFLANAALKEIKNAS